MKARHYCFLHLRRHQETKEITKKGIIISDYIHETPTGMRKMPAGENPGYRLDTRVIKTTVLFLPQLHIPHSLGFEHNIIRQLDQLPETFLNLVERTIKQTHLSTRGGAVCACTTCILNEAIVLTHYQAQIALLLRTVKIHSSLTILGWLSLPTSL